MRALVVGALLVVSPEVQALPPQAVAAGAAALSWMAALGGTLLALLMSLVPRRARWALVTGAACAAVVCVWWWAAHRSPAPIGRVEAATSDWSVSGATAASWMADPATLWIDLRSESDWSTGRVAGAELVGLVVGQPFDPAAMDALGAPGALAELASAPADRPNDWARLAERFRGGGLLAVPALARVDALYRAGPPGAVERVVMYCHSGRTSTPLVAALRHRGVPAFVVAGGVNALPARQLEGGELPAGGASQVPTVLPAPDEPTLAAWARWVGSPPPELPTPGVGVTLALTWHDTPSRQRALWLRPIAYGWGYGAVEIAAATVGDAAVSPSGRAGSRSARALWLALLGLLLLIPLAAPRMELRRRLQGRSVAATAGLAAGAQLALLLVLDLGFNRAWGPSPWDRLMDAPVALAEALRLAIGLAMLWHLAWPRRVRVLRVLDSWRVAAGAQAGRPEPAPGVGWTALAIALTAGVLAAWARPVTVAVALVALVVEPAWLAVMAAWGRQRLRATAGDPDRGAARLLRSGGLAPRTGGDPVVVVTTRDPTGPGWGRIRRERTGEESPVGLLTHSSPLLRHALHLAAVVGADVVASFDEHGACVHVRRLGAPSLAQADDVVRRQLLEVLWRGLRAGIPPTSWSGLALRADRFDEVAARPSPLTLDVLRRRGGARGAEGRAGRRFGRGAVGDIVRLGSRVYDVTWSAGSSPPTRWLERLAARAVVARSMEMHDRRLQTTRSSIDRLIGAPGNAAARRVVAALRRLPGPTAAWAAETALASEVAGRRVAELAAAEALSASPPLSADDTQRSWPLDGVAEDAYELGAAREVSPPSPCPLHTASDLAHGPGSDRLRRWRGTRRAAEEARDAARVLLLAEVAAAGEALRRLAEERRLADLWTFMTIDELAAAIRPGQRRRSACRRAEERRALLASVSEWPAPQRLDAVTIEGLGRTPDVTRPAGAGTAILSGHPTGSGLPRDGLIGETVVLVELASPELLERCAAAGHAVLARRGSPLSHAAVVAREFGVPAILGAGERLDRLRPGDSVRLQADGAVVLLQPAETTRRNEV